MGMFDNLIKKAFKDMSGKKGGFDIMEMLNPKPDNETKELTKIEGFWWYQCLKCSILHCADRSQNPTYCSYCGNDVIEAIEEIVIHG